MDFVSDRLLHGRVLRALTLLDEHSRYALAVDPAFSYPSASVVRTLDEAAPENGYPSACAWTMVRNSLLLRSNTGHEHSVELLFIQPGKPTQSAFIESFNSLVRDELLAANRFGTIFEAGPALEECGAITTAVIRITTSET